MRHTGVVDLRFLDTAKMKAHTTQFLLTRSNHLDAALYDFTQAEIELGEEQSDGRHGGKEGEKRQSEQEAIKRHAPQETSHTK
jgi:hypothetical protein